MTIKKTDRDQLIENASYLFRVKGYHNTSISDIASACNLSKGSVYHYITSKKELAIAVINQLHDYFKEHFFSIAYQEHLSSKERLVAFVKGTETFFIGRDGGCLMGNLALEAVDTVPEFAELLRHYFTEWIDALAHILTKKFGSTKARELAENAVSHYQGAIMMMRLYQNDSHFMHQVTQRVLEWMDVEVGTVGQREKSTSLE